MKKLLALALTLALTLSAAPALAAGTDPFPATKPYPGFADVAAGAWYEKNVKTCVETGLMVGTNAGFAPGNPMQVAEVATIAARINAALTGKQIPMPTPKVGETLPWYEGYLSYLNTLATAAKDTALLSRLAQPESPATRGDFISMLALVVPETQLPAKNKVTALPDSTDAEVSAFYNAGILQGVGDYGFFYGSKGLSRAEAAAMIARVVRPDQRLAFTLKVDTGFTAAALGYAPDAPFFTMATHTVTAEEYAKALADQIDAVAASAAKQNMEFNWNLTVSGTPVVDFVTQETISALYLRYVTADYAAAHGFTFTDNADFSAKAAADLLRPESTAMDGYLAAKHILIKDKAKAETVLAALKKDPSQFDALMNQFSEDGRDAAGNLAAPNGYLFSAGDMIPEFEAGTKALKIGEISPLVSGAYGYHIILRTDPQSKAYVADYLQKFFVASLETYNPVAVGDTSFDVQVFYSKVLDWRARQK